MYHEEDDDNYSLPDITGRVTIFTTLNASEKSESKKAQRPKFERHQEDISFESQESFD